MRFAVTGSREFDDIKENWLWVGSVLETIDRSATLVHGNARGVDEMCRRWWYGHNGRNIEAHPADWLKHGKAAGPIRNQEMIDSGLDFLIAFPGGKGTADMTKRAQKAGVPIRYATDYL